ncbi:hypothetical protein CJ430_29190, partial [Klebsiella pneumoniae]
PFMLGITVAISLLAIFCASRMKSALGTAPPGRKAPDRSPPGYYGADYPARRRCACAAYEEITPRGIPLIPGPVRQ